MKKLGVVVKEASAKEIKSSLKDSSSLFVIKYSGLSSFEISTLRQSLKESRAKLFVVKNAVARRALKDSGLDNLVKHIEGPCGLIFVQDEPVGTSGILCSFAKEHDKLVVEAGLSKNRFLDRKDIEAIAKLPPKDVMRAQLVSTLNAPIAGLAIALNQIIAKFAICIDQIRISKEKDKA